MLRRRLLVFWKPRRRKSARRGEFYGIVALLDCCNLAAEENRRNAVPEAPALAAFYRHSADMSGLWAWPFLQRRSPMNDKARQIHIAQRVDSRRVLH